MRGTRLPTLARYLTFAAVLVAGAAIAPTAHAKDDPAADAKVQSATVEIKKLEVADKRNVATSEIGRATALRDKARSIIGERKQRDTLAQTLDELEATIALANARIIEAQRKADVDAQATKLAQLRKQIDKVRADVAKLEKKMRGGK